MASTSNQQVAGQRKSSKEDATSTVDVGQFNAVASNILSTISGLGDIAAQINAAATAAGALAAQAAIVAINKAKEEAITAIRAEIQPKLHSADNPKFQTPERVSPD